VMLSLNMPQRGTRREGGRGLLTRHSLTLWPLLPAHRTTLHPQVTTSANRKMEFTITHPTSAKKEAAYWIDVTIASTKQVAARSCRAFCRTPRRRVRVCVCGGWNPTRVCGVVSVHVSAQCKTC
jgi:hypothetical protein